MDIDFEQWKGLIGGALWSASFFGETKMGIPWAIYYGVPAWLAYLVCCFANLLAFPFTMIFFDSFHNYFMKFPKYRNWADKFFQKTRKQTQKLVKKYGLLGILIFVMFPVPMTGAYMGSIACWLFEMDRKRSFVAVAIGAFIAGALILLLLELGLMTYESIE